jgi:hypothetical protein
LRPETGYLHFAPYIKSDCGRDLNNDKVFSRMRDIYTLFREEVRSASPAVECAFVKSRAQLCPPTLQLAAWSAQFFVSKQRILANSVSKYKRMLGIVEVRRRGGILDIACPTERPYRRPRAIGCTTTPASAASTGASPTLGRRTRGSGTASNGAGPLSLAATTLPLRTGVRSRSTRQSCVSASIGDLGTGRSPHPTAHTHTHTHIRARIVSRLDVVLLHSTSRSQTACGPRCPAIFNRPPPRMLPTHRRRLTGGPKAILSRLQLPLFALSRPASPARRAAQPLDAFRTSLLQSAGCLPHGPSWSSSLAFWNLLDVYALAAAFD